MPMEDVAFYNHSPARAQRPMSSLATPPRNSTFSTTPNSSPSPRIPLGRSPQRTSYYSSQAHAANEAPPVDGRTSVDSAAIFSIYSMYGSDSGSGSAGRRESVGPSRLIPSHHDSNRTSIPSYASQSTDYAGANSVPVRTQSILGYEGPTHVRQEHHQPDLAPQDYQLDDHHHRDQHRQRQQSQEGRVSSLSASSFQDSRHDDVDSGDSKIRSSFRPTAASTVSGPSSYNSTRPTVNGNDSSSYRTSLLPLTSPSKRLSNYDKGNRILDAEDEEDDDDDSLILDIEIGSTVAGGSSPPSPTTPSSRTPTMSFFSSPSKLMKKNKQGRVKSTASTASSTAGGKGSELAYFDTGIMPLVPPPPQAPSALSTANGSLDNRGLGSTRNSYVRGEVTDDFASNYNGAMNGSLNTKNSNRMSMSNWLPDPIAFLGRQPVGANGVHPASHSLPQQSATPHQLESQPLVSSVPSVAHSEPPTLPTLPPLHHSLSLTSSHSHSSNTSSVYATPLTEISHNTAPVLGQPKRNGSLESGVSMPANNGSTLGHYPSSLSSSRRNSPSPSLPSAAAPPSSYQPANQHYNQHSSPSSRRQTPSPAPSRAGSLAAPTPSIVYPQPQQHSPHSSLSHNSTHSHQSYGASSVITRDTAVSAISGTTATTSGSGVEQSAPPMPVYQHSPQLGMMGPTSPLSRQSQASQGSSSHSNSPSQAHQSYASSGGHRSIGAGEAQIPKFDKDLPHMPGRESPGVMNRGSGQSNMSNGGERRPSPAPALNVNGSPHRASVSFSNGASGGVGTMRDSSGPRQSRLVPVGLGAAAPLSHSISQQSTATTATTGTSATMSSTAVTTANSTPDPNAAGQGFVMNSPHASLTPHRSSSSMRNRVNSSNSPHQSVISTGRQVGGGANSIKAQSMRSLVPSLGEDVDSFHVRNTYAQLEVSGVKGDGYEEGVERTRAARTRVPSSVSHSPSVSGADTSGSVEDGSSAGYAKTRRTKSQVLADAAIADENEKKRELDPKEVKILGSLDRYGFFTVPSHDRLLLLPSQPLLKPLPFSPSVAASASPPSPSTLAAPPSPSQHPTSGASAAPKSLSALPPVVTPGKEGSRIAKWGRMLMPHARDEGGNVQAWMVRPSKTAKLRRRTYKGIPDRWRAAAWEVLMTAYSNAAEGENDDGRRKSPGGSDGNVNMNVGGVSVETTLRQTANATAVVWGVRQVERTEREYRDALEKPSSYDIQIDLDVPRTISGHIMFRTRYGAGQRSLFHVLHSFSLRCPSCGYVQGMGPIAATLLSYMSPSLAYTSLVRLHDAYSLHSVFSPGFPGLLEAIYVQERLTQTTMPAVYDAFQKHMISTTSYATKWYITLFANSVPFQTQLRLWDVFLLEGYDVYIAVAIAVVWVYRDHITSAAANFETVLSLLSGFFVPEDEDTLLGWIEKMLGDRRVRSAMKEWRKEWRELVRQGKDGTALL